MNTINERIKEIRKIFANNSNVDFANMLGSKPNTTSNYVRNGYNVGRGVASKIAETFNVSIEWLLTGDGEMLRENSKEVTRSVENNNIEVFLREQLKEKDNEIKELSRRIGQLEAENSLLKERHFRDMDVSDVDSAVAG